MVTVVKIKKITQGLSEVNNRKLLSEMLEVKGTNKVYLSTAFATVNGVELIKDALQKVGGNTEAYIGVRNGVTSYQALLALKELGVKVFAVDTGSDRKIYHDKMYITVNDQSATLLTGSCNLTKGGLLTNIESGIKIDCDLSNKEDYHFYSECLQQLLDLKKLFPENVYEIVNEEFVTDMLEDGLLIDEDRTKVRRVVGKSKTRELNFSIPSIKTIIEKIKNKKKTKAIEKVEDIQDEELVITVPLHSEGNYNVLSYKEIWKSKPLTTRDLNIPSGSNTNPTGSMLLKKGVYPIDQQTYFYEKAFSDLHWSSGLGEKAHFKYAKAHFDFLIDGVFIPGVELDIKHDIRTDTATYLQKQPMTHLSWGEAKKLIAKSHLLDQIMIMYKNVEKNGHYLIKIEPGE